MHGWILLYYCKESSRKPTTPLVCRTRQRRERERWSTAKSRSKIQTEERNNSPAEQQRKPRENLEKPPHLRLNGEGVLAQSSRMSPQDNPRRVQLHTNVANLSNCLLWAPGTFISNTRQPESLMPVKCFTKFSTSSSTCSVLLPSHYGHRL